MSVDWHIRVENKVNEILNKYAITHCPAKELNRIAQSEGLTLIPVDHDDDSCGFLDEFKNIYYNSNMIKSRYNFTIAHEFGHYFLNHELRGEYSRLYRDFTKVEYEKDPQEVEANYFAACFLIPRSMARPVFNRLTNQLSNIYIKPVRIENENSNLEELSHLVSAYKNNFLVSTQTAFYRLITLGYAKVYDNFDMNCLYKEKLIIKGLNSILPSINAFSNKLVVFDNYSDLFID